MPGCDSGVVVLSWFSPRLQHHAAVARKIHLSRLFNFPEPPLFKMGQCAQQNWRKLRGFNHLAEVIEGINFKDGIKQPQPETTAA
jgi:hypothetical protein